MVTRDAKLMSLNGDVHHLAAQDIWHPDVTGVGVGKKKIDGIQTDEVCLKYFVNKKLPRDMLPAFRLLPTTRRLGSRVYLTDVEVAPPASAPLLNRLIDDRFFAPEIQTLTLHGGISAAHYSAGFGTAGCFYSRREFPSKPEFFISCNHVFANYNLASAGDIILSPARAQGGMGQHRPIGSLTWFVPLRSGQVNLFDLALAHIDIHHEATENIAYITSKPAPVDVRPGDTVFKIGSGSGQTAGTIIATHATVKINYWVLGPSGKDTIFANQIITTPMGQLGDSGAVLINDENVQIGILFAGSYSLSYFNYLWPALRLLRLVE